MRIQSKDHRFYALFPPYRKVEWIEDPSTLPSTPKPPRGAVLVWNLTQGDWGGGFRAVRDRPPGVALFILLPPASQLGGLDPLLKLMEHCRPHSILPHLETLHPEDLLPYLKRFPVDFDLEVTDYLTWRGIEVDMETRRLIRKTLDLSGQLRTVSGLARSLYISRRALGRRFLSRGLPVPSHWLHFGRILRASIRMQRGDHTLSSIAFDLGYPDGFSLSNQMKRLTGLRPSLMRECFGWEWIVEAWLFEEARAGNLSPELSRHLFGSPSPGSSSRARLQEAEQGPPTRRMRVAERNSPVPRKRRSNQAS